MDRSNVAARRSFTNMQTIFTPLCVNFGQVEIQKGGIDPPCFRCR